VACASSPPISGCGTPLDHQRAKGCSRRRGHRIRRQPDWFLARYPVQHFAVRSARASPPSRSRRTRRSRTSRSARSTNCQPRPGDRQPVRLSARQPQHRRDCSRRWTRQGGNAVVLDGANLGCVCRGGFGNVVTFETTNSQAFAGLWHDRSVVVAAPARRRRDEGSVRVATVESVFDPKGLPSNSVAYTYTRARPARRPG